MGAVLSNLFQRKSKIYRKSTAQRLDEEVIGLNNNSNDLQFVGQLVPERYLVLLTEQMTEMLFCLMIL